MYTDIVGFTALTQSDEAQTLAVLERHNRLLRPIFPRFHGREVKAIGDSFLVEFESALDATNCAIEVQRLLHDYNISSRDEWKITLRIGIHLGDVVRSGSDILGDAVNIASRLQPLAEPEGVCISQQVYDQVRNKVPHALVKLEPHDLKGVKFQVDVYKVVMPWDQSAADATPSFATNRIAILPFRNMSPDPNDEFFAEGMTEEIISTVAGISGLSVISRTSVMQYKKTEKTVKQIGRELEVGSVLEGSFRKAGNKMRVTTQLIDVAGDRHLWAQNYDRNIDDVFEVQSDVAKQVADALRVKILSQELERIDKKPTDNIDAYALYLKGRQIWNKRGLDDMKEAAACFQQSVEKDPSFALGYAGQADSYLLLANNWREDPEQNLERAKTLVAKALELDPELAEAHATRGLILQWYGNSLEDADAEYRKAIELKPSYGTAHQWYASLLLDFDRFEDAFSEIKKALESDPLSEPIFSAYCNYFHYLHQNHEWLAAANRLIESHPEHSYGYRHRAFAEGWLGREEEARRDYETSYRLRKNDRARPADEAFLEAQLGNDRKARELIAIVYQKADGPSLDTLFNTFAVLGDKEKFFAWVDFSIKRQTVTAGYLRYDPCLDKVRDDPRFKDLYKEFGLKE
jgi:TolB-like protein